MSATLRRYVGMWQAATARLSESALQGTSRTTGLTIDSSVRQPILCDTCNLWCRDAQRSATETSLCPQRRVLALPGLTGEVN